MKTNSTDSNSRLILPISARGNTGKSLLLQALGGYCDQRGIVWTGYDLDGSNQSFSRAFPDRVSLRPITGSADHDAILAILRQSLKSEGTTIIDPRAHIDTDLLAVIKKTHFLDRADEAGLRLTVVIVPGDDMDLMEHLAATVSEFGDRVDWLLNHNLAKFPTLKMFRGTPLEVALIGYGARTLTLPVLYDTVRLRWLEVESQQGRGVNLAEFAMNDSLGVDLLIRAIAEEFLKDLYRQFDGIAPILLTQKQLKDFKPASTSATPASATRKRGTGFNYNINQ
jgi:hypothetical protein